MGGDLIAVFVKMMNKNMTMKTIWGLVKMTSKRTTKEIKRPEIKGWYYNEEAFGYSTIKKEN